MMKYIALLLIAACLFIVLLQQTVHAHSQYKFEKNCIRANGFDTHEAADKYYACLIGLVALACLMGFSIFMIVGA